MRGRSSAIHSHSTGSASAGRQNAVAVGGSSLRRTKIGDAPMAVAPSHRAGQANGATVRGAMAAGSDMARGL